MILKIGRIFHLLAEPLGLIFGASQEREGLAEFDFSKLVQILEEAAAA